MILLEVDRIRKQYGPAPVLTEVTFDVRPGDRIGLVGPNGCGKTTLMHILAGREEPDGGQCRSHPSVHLGYLEQQAEFEPGRTLYDEAKTALANLIELQHEAEEVAHALSDTTTDPAEHHRLALRYDHLQHELQQNDAYNLEHKIERVLTGLGFTSDRFTQPVVSLSGGEQNRLLLAKFLLAEPNVMLLDEPSNHLDIEATEWLEQFLIESSAAIIVVSHDRYFLDKVTNRTLELFHGTVDSYQGNFSAYWTQKAERLLVQRRTFEKQQIELEKTKDFIRRNHYGLKATQAEDRRKKLERLEEELVAPPREIALPPMRFTTTNRSGDIVVRAKELAKSYDRPLFQDLSLDIIRGERWALLGPNGCGKTTLLRCLLGQETPDSGTVHLGQGLILGYFDQHLASLADDAEVVDAIRPSKKDFNIQQRRDLLAKFGLTGDKAMQTVVSLSGGERCRAALARLSAEDANFLILDEPTNHLDLWARDALEHALTNFDGTVLFVSHDRYFVNQVADHLIVVEPNGIRLVDGNYDTYQEELIHGIGSNKTPRRGSKPSTTKSSSAKISTNTPSKASSNKPTKKRKFTFRKVTDIERDIANREQLLKDFEQQLIDPNTQRNNERLRTVVTRMEEEREALRDLYEHWEEASELNW